MTEPTVSEPAPKETHSSDWAKKVRTSCWNEFVGRLIDDHPAPCDPSGGLAEGVGDALVENGRELVLAFPPISCKVHRTKVAESFRFTDGFRIDRWIKVDANGSRLPTERQKVWLADRSERMPLPARRTR